MLVAYIISTLDEQSIKELLIDRNPKNLNTKFVDYASMIMTFTIVFFFRDLDFLWCAVLSVVMFIGINKFLRFWYRSYVEVAILFNLELLQLSDELKSKIKNKYEGEIR